MSGNYVRTADIPSAMVEGKVELDPNSNFFRKDSKIPTSNVVCTASYVDKSNYVPTIIGEEHEVHKLHYAYEESLTDIGGGFFKVDTRYAQVPDTWYSFETINIPYLKFRGLSVISGGSITINTAYLFNFLNVQSISDVSFFNEDGYTNFEEKSGTINVACRIKHEYVLLTEEDISNGTIDDKMAFTASSDANSFGDGKFNCGYFMKADDPQNNVSIDKESTFTFTAEAPSPKVRISSGVYAGIIYYKNSYEIVSDVKI